MKKVFFCVVAAVFAVALAFTSCRTQKVTAGKGGGEVKLLESITDDKGEVLRKFEYDEQNRLVKKYSGKDSTIITYNSDDLVTVKTSDGDKKYVIKGNTVTLDKETFIINEDWYVVKRESDGHQYQYQNGNLIQEGPEDTASDYLNTDYSYDDKKSPFSNCTSPKWLLQSVLSYSYSAASKNNVTRSSYEGGSSGYEYEYDSDGFPTKETNTDYDAYEGGGESTTITRYTYLVKKQSAPVEAESGLEQTNKAEAHAAAKPDTLYITETGYVDLWPNVADDNFGMNVYQVTQQLRDMGVAVMAAEGKHYLSFALADGKQHVIETKTAVAGTEMLLYKKGHPPIAIQLDVPTDDYGHIMEAVNKYLGIKLLESITDKDGNLWKKFEYDRQNRIVKIVESSSAKTITYADNLITAEEGGKIENFAINGDTVTTKRPRPITLILNADGCIAKYGMEGWFHDYQYKDGNLIEIKGGGSDEDNYKKYDNKKSPFSNSNTPKWLLQYLFIHDAYIYGSKNNVLEREINGEYRGNQTYVHQYEYDGDGFPTKQTEKTFEHGEEISETITRFTYLSKGEKQ